MLRAVVPVLAGLIVCSTSACSGPASPTGAETLDPIPLLPAVANQPTVVLSQVLEGVERGGQRVLTFNVPSASDLEVAFLWSDSRNSVSAVLTGEGCPYPYLPASACYQRRSFERSGGASGEGFITYSGADGAYRLAVENGGPGVETIDVTATAIFLPGVHLPTPYPTAPPH
jgi:hypothetical protein